MKKSKFEKKWNKIDFLKLLMVKSDVQRCNYCKYHWKNYRYPNSKMQSLAMNHFATRCGSCINSRSFMRLTEEQKNERYWYTDKFKPLYDWEEFESEGDKNG